MPPRRKLLLSAFTLLHWTAVTLWLLPASCPPREALLPAAEPGARPGGPLAAYLRGTAQFQSWTMFAPDPLNANRFLTAQLVHARGERREYAFPRLSELGVWDSWAEKRYRKLTQRLADLKDPRLSEAVARWAAREAGLPGNPVVHVTLVLHEALIPKPGTLPPGTDTPKELRESARYVPIILADLDLADGGPR